MNPLKIKNGDAAERAHELHLYFAALHEQGRDPEPWQQYELRYCLYLIMGDHA
jgi:hypothetical protein